MVAPVHVTDSRLRAASVAAYAVTPRAAILDLRLADDQLGPVRQGHGDRIAAGAAGPVYGVSTGVGALRDITIDPVAGDAGDAVVRSGDHDPHALRLWRSHASGMGPELDDQQARATMVIRLHQLLRGGSGVHESLPLALAAALQRGATPRLHSFGAVGTGDLTQLAELGLTLIGELPWRAVELPDDLQPTRLQAGDALAFMSSNAATAAVAALATTSLTGLARVAEQVAALSHLALRGALPAYDPRLFDDRDDEYAAGVARRLSALLRGPERASARVQDPFGLRTVPQAHGPWEEALARAERAVSAEIDARTENPQFTDGQALHHGQFMTQRLAIDLDAARAATVPALSLSSARIAALLDPRLTGLSAFLADGPPGSSGMMATEYVSADLLARIRTVAAPVTGQRTIASLGQEEHASHSTQAAWLTRDLVPLAADVLAVELVCVVRALRLAPDRLVGSPAEEVFDRAAAALPDVRHDHALAPELENASELVRELGARSAQVEAVAAASSSGRSSSAYETE